MRGAIFLAILAALATPAEAARKRVPRPAPLPPSAIEPTDAVLSVVPSANGDTLTVKGWMDVGSFLKFRRVQAANPNAKIVLFYSPGGIIQEGALIASAIRDAGMNTQIFTLCASACTLAFAGGTGRFAHPDAWLGFHRARWVSSAKGEAPAVGAAADTDVLQRATLRRAGVDATFISKAMGVASDAIWFPDRQTLLAANVLTPDDGHWVGGDNPLAVQMAARLRADALWQAVESKAPEQFAAALALAWRLDSAGVDYASIMAEAQSGLARALLWRIASAPEPLATAFLASMTAGNADACATAGWGARLPTTAQQTRQAEILTRIFLQESAELEMSSKEARKVLRKLMARAAAAFPGLRRSSDADLRCRAGLDLVKRIAALDGGRRHRAFQAYALLQKEGELPAYAIPA